MCLLDVARRVADARPGCGDGGSDAPDEVGAQRAKVGHARRVVIRRLAVGHEVEAAQVPARTGRGD